MNINELTARDIADSMIANFYNFASLDAATEYFRAELMTDDDADLTDRAELIDTLDRDIRDALHNANLDFYFADDELATLTDDDYDALADRMLAELDTLTPMIADHLLSR
jgi:hypothetical protein